MASARDDEIAQLQVWDAKISAWLLYNSEFRSEKVERGNLAMVQYKISPTSILWFA